MSDDEGLTDMMEEGRANAAFAWLLTAFVALVAVRSALTGELLWAGFCGGIVVLALFPPVGFRDPTVMVPWEVLALGALPVVARSFAVVPLTSRVTTQVSVAALALLVAVELDVFTPVQMTDWFAVLFVVIGTMATAGVWALAQWLSDVYLSTEYMLTGAPEAEIERAVMWDFVAATGVGVLAGLLFVLYFRRRARAKQRLPTDVQEVVE
ncbi:MAG: hypothetical protein ABEJ68_05595 [Halobacteriaceae archaeon]